MRRSLLSIAAALALAAGLLGGTPAHAQDSMQGMERGAGARDKPDQDRGAMPGMQGQGMPGMQGMQGMMAPLPGMQGMPMRGGMPGMMMGPMMGGGMTAPTMGQGMPDQQAMAAQMNQMMAQMNQMMAQMNRMMARMLEMMAANGQGAEQMRPETRPGGPMQPGEAPPDE